MLTLVQWIHVGAAVIGVGGIGFLLIILMPALGVLEPDQKDRLLGAVTGRFRWASWSVIFLLIASGLYNIKLRAWGVPWGTYWEFLTVKIALALAVFLIALCLTLPFKALDSFRARRRLWLSLAFALGMTVILISAYLRG